MTLAQAYILIACAAQAVGTVSPRYESNVFGLMNAGHMLGALAGGGALESRQQQCINPTWVPLCGGALPCAPPGAACCGTMYYYFPETQFCCPSGEGACPLGTTCCDPFCCVAGAVCSNGMCARPTAPTQPTQTRTTASRSTSTATSTSAPTTTAGPTQTTTRPTQTTTARTSTEDDACTVPSLVERGLPTMTVPYVERYTTIPNSGGKQVCLDNREVMNSMCKGIKKASGCDAEEMKLTYRPDLEKTNRDTMCPKGPDGKGYCYPYNNECLDPNDTSGNCNPYANYMTNPIKDYDYDVFHLSCDEFPFAKSAQGGKVNKGTSICVPGWQNSFQGSKLNQLGRKVGAGNDYIIQVTGWDCKNGRPTGTPTNCKRAIRRDDVGGSAFTEDDLFMNFTDDGQHALMMYLGDVDPGLYTYNLSIATGALNDVRAIDSQGTTIGTPVGTLNGTHTVTVRVDDEAYGVSLWGFTADTKLSVVYNITSADPPAPNGTATPTPTPSVAGREVMGAWTLGVVLAAVLMWLC